MSPKQAFVNLFAQATGAAIVLTGLYFMETRLFPVVDDFVVERIERTPAAITFQGRLDKQRLCEFVGMTVYGITPTGDRSLMYQFKKDIFGADVGVGRQSWGPVSVPSIPAHFAKAEVMATHRCHPLWLQSTVYTTFDLTRIPK